MKTKAILLQLVDYLDEFEAENQHAETLEIGDFIGYLHARYPLTGKAMRQNIMTNMEKSEQTILN